jgi:glycosyltransferase involved in cell wall biosynthesis
MYKVLMIAPGQAAKGGIVQVLNYYKETTFWNNNKVRWIATHCDGNKIRKMFCFIEGFVIFIFYLPTCKIVHLHFAGGASANRKFIIFLLCKIFKKKTLAHVHQGSPTNKDLHGIANHAFLYMIKHADKVILLSRNLIDGFKEIYNREYLILNNPSKGIVDINNLKKEKIFLFAGRLEQAKGCFDLLEAIKLVHNQIDYKFILAGNGNINLANDFIAANGLTDVVEITGWLSTENIQKLYQKAEIFILPSYWEGFPISIIDALSNMCCVITTPVGGIPDLLEHNENCVFVNSGNIRELGNAILKVTHDHNFCNFIAKNGYNLAKREFDIDIITEQLNSIYNGMLNK